MTEKSMMDDFYRMSIRILYDELLSKRNNIESSLNSIKSQNSRLAGDLRRMLIMYDLLLSHFGKNDA